MVTEYIKKVTNFIYIQDGFHGNRVYQESNMLHRVTGLLWTFYCLEFLGSVQIC